MADEISKAIIDTLIAEAAGQGEESMRRVAETILNRSAIRNLTPEQVVTQANQYTGYSNPGPGAVRSQNNPAVRALAEAAWRTAMEPGDPTGGADHYYAPGTISQPSWARGMTPTGQYGGHNYYSSRPIPPSEIPNTVATALSVTPTPRVAPSPVTISPDLAQMRNPIMSSSARYAQVTPSGDVPLPRQRPVTAMDIARAPGQTIATIPTTARPGQSQIERTQPSAREIAMAPGTTIATIPTSGIGQPPATRSVQSVPYSLQPTAREIAEAPGVTIATIPTATTPTASQIASAARRAALTANQSNVERNPAPAAPMYQNMRSRDSVANTALGQRVAAQVGPAFNQPAFVPNRLPPNPIVQPTVAPRLNQPPIQVVPSSLPALPMAANRAPMPMAASARPLVGSHANPVRVPAGMAITSAMLPQLQAAQQYGLPIGGSSAPLRAVVNGAGSYSAPQPVTPVQALQAQGMTAAQAYNALTASAPTLEDRVRGSTGLSSSGAGAYSISG